MWAFSYASPYSNNVCQWVNYCIVGSVWKTEYLRWCWKWVECKGWSNCADKRGTGTIPTAYSLPRWYGNNITLLLFSQQLLLQSFLCHLFSCEWNVCNLWLEGCFYFCRRHSGNWHLSVVMNIWGRSMPRNWSDPSCWIPFSCSRPDRKVMFEERILKKSCCCYWGRMKLVYFS